MRHGSVARDRRSTVSDRRRPVDGDVGAASRGVNCPNSARCSVLVRSRSGGRERDQKEQRNGQYDRSLNGVQQGLDASRIFLNGRVKLGRRLAT